MTTEGDGGGAGHREIEHTADLAFEVWAPSLEELFGEALRATLSLCYERSDVEARERRTVEVEGESREELLVAWIEEAYFQVEFDGWLVADAESMEPGEGSFRGALLGEPYDEERHTYYTEIKAVTYHEMAIGRGDDGLWRTRVILDV